MVPKVVEVVELEWDSNFSPKWLLQIVFVSLNSFYLETSTQSQQCSEQQIFGIYKRQFKFFILLFKSDWRFDFFQRKKKSNEGRRNISSIVYLTLILVQAIFFFIITFLYTLKFSYSWFYYVTLTILELLTLKHYYHLYGFYQQTILELLNKEIYNSLTSKIHSSDIIKIELY